MARCREAGARSAQRDPPAPGSACGHRPPQHCRRSGIRRVSRCAPSGEDQPLQAAVAGATLSKRPPLFGIANSPGFALYRRWRVQLPRAAAPQASPTTRGAGDSHVLRDQAVWIDPEFAASSQTFLGNGRNCGKTPRDNSPHVGAGILCRLHSGARREIFPRCQVQHDPWCPSERADVVPGMGAEVEP